jgi:hypothetical protein
MRQLYFKVLRVSEATGAEEETKISSSGEWGKYRNPTRLRGGVVHKLGLGGSVMAVARRQFLQALGAVCGLQFLLPTAVRAAELQYVSTLNTSARKLAVLVGINQYESNPLHGCITDVELQRELLVHRFGFLPQDIVVLTDQAATQGAIATAVQEHLVKQARAGDVVLFHFSGHGTKVIGAGAVGINALVATDGYIPEASLLSWLSSAPTDKVVCVLDAGTVYPGSPVVGNFRIRSQPSRRDEQLVAQVGLESKVPTVLRAVEGTQLCADAQWTGFSSGLFTYALTQQLWQTTSAPALQMALSQIRQAFPLQVQSEAPPVALPLQPAVPVSADGVIRGTTPDRRAAETWLGGLPIMPVSYYGVGSLLSVAEDGEFVAVRSHNGLTAKVEVTGSGQRLQWGQLLQERVRALPKQMNLVIALDLGLNRVERVDATSAISSMPNMVGVSAGEHAADCLFGTQSASYGLFSVSREPFLGSFGSVGESVGAALRRLQPLLESLLAAKLLRLTSNQASSCLVVRVALQVGAEGRQETIALHCTERSLERSPQAKKNFQLYPAQINNRSLALGDRLSCVVENLMDIPLYVAIFSFDARGRMLVPSFLSSPYASEAIALPGKTLVIPDPKSPFSWSASAPQGLVTFQVVLSRQPLQKTALALAQSLQQAPNSTGMVTAPNPLEIVHALLEDLHQEDMGNEAWMLDVNNWATLDFAYRVA